MSMQDFEAAIELITRNIGSSHFAGPKTDELIGLAEEALGLQFPPTYRRFLKELGCGSVGGEEFYGVNRPNFESASVPDAIWVTLKHRERAQLPSHFIVVGEDGASGEYLIDTSRVASDRECPVVYWYGRHHAPGEHLEVVASDFGKFFLDMVSEAIRRWERRVGVAR
jgi:hypothetical protein